MKPKLLNFDDLSSRNRGVWDPNYPTIKSEVIADKKSLSIEVLRLLLQGKELCVLNVDQYGIGARWNQLSSAISHIKTVFGVPVCRAWSPEKVMLYWMDPEDIEDFMDGEARKNQFDNVCHEVHWQRMERSLLAAMKTARSVNGAPELMGSFAFLHDAFVDLVEEIKSGLKKYAQHKDRADKSISPENLNEIEVIR